MKKTIDGLVSIRDLKAEAAAAKEAWPEKVKKGKSVKIRSAKAVKAASKKTLKKHRALKYETSNASVATVTSKGKVRGVNKGTCYICVYAQDGAVAKVRVKVK